MPSHTFQAPKGTRDFLPAEMAVRRHLEGVWRQVSIDHGFDEIDGPTFEHLDLYTVKSGPGIVSELFSFRRAGGETQYALRPEFTPTLARMFAASAASLPRPTKWFSIPNHFRAERPQRGRLREFGQWNVDLIGDDSPRADAEVLAVAVGALERFGLRPEQIRIRLSHRGAVAGLLREIGVADDRLAAAFDLLDRRDKLDAAEFEARAAAIDLSAEQLARFDLVAGAADDEAQLARRADEAGLHVGLLDDLTRVREAAAEIGLADWITMDLGIVRGLAYYTGTVFEIHETTGAERAVAGGGRYDQLIELFGGPPTPAVGFAMGDVVIRLVLEDRNLLGDPATLGPRPDVFVIAAAEEADVAMRSLVAALRREGHHARHTYRATRNVGKLLREADRVRARMAIILGRELAEGRVALKDLASGDQTELELDRVAAELAVRLRANAATEGETG